MTMSSVRLSHLSKFVHTLLVDFGRRLRVAKVYPRHLERCHLLYCRECHQGTTSLKPDPIYLYLVIFIVSRRSECANMCIKLV
jgi:hypothetical protein